MEDSLFEAIQISVWVFLFIFALSFALIQYNHIDAVIDLFVDVNMFGSREDFVGVFLDESEIERNALRAEAVLSILNIPNTATETGNFAYTVTLTEDGGPSTDFKYFQEPEVSDYPDSRGVETTGALSKKYYLQGVVPSGANNTSDLINDITSTYAPSATTKYSVEYDDDSICYKKK